jgi:hypothetical protein
VVHGPAGVKQFVTQYLVAFSHAQSVVEDQVAEGDRSWCGVDVYGHAYWPMDGPPTDWQACNGQGDGALSPRGR